MEGCAVPDAGAERLDQSKFIAAYTLLHESRSRSQCRVLARR